MKNIYRLSLVSIAFIIFCGCASTKTSMISAASAGDINTIKKFHTEGKDINERDSAGTTALMYAIFSKKSDVAKYLIESGADVKAKDNNGYDALRYAIDYKQLDLMEILIDKGADIESRDSAIMTPLAYAVWQVRDINAINLLIKKGANLNAKDAESQTPLDLALAIDGRLDIVNALINAGAEIFEPENGKARLLFIGEEFFLKDGAWVTVGNVNKYIKKGAGLAFMDIASGNQKIVISVSWFQTQPELSIDVKVGQTYYFKILQRSESRIAGIAGGIAGGFVGSVLGQVAVEKGGGIPPFEIIPVEESIAKEKVKTLLKITK